MVSFIPGRLIAVLIFFAVIAGIYWFLRQAKDTSSVGLDNSKVATENVEALTEPLLANQGGGDADVAENTVEPERVEEYNANVNANDANDGDATAGGACEPEAENAADNVHTLQA